MDTSAFVGTNLTGGAIRKVARELRAIRAAAPKLLAIHFYEKPTFRLGAPAKKHQTGRDKNQKQSA